MEYYNHKPQREHLHVSASRPFVLQTDMSTSQILTLSQQEVGHQRPLQWRLPELKSVRNFSQQQLHHDQQLVDLKTDAELMSVISQRKSPSLLLETPHTLFNVCDRRQRRQQNVSESNKCALIPFQLDISCFSVSLWAEMLYDTFHVINVSAAGTTPVKLSQAVSSLAAGPPAHTS